MYLCFFKLKSKLTNNAPNPTGKGGFKDNPQNIGKGHWDKTMSISYNQAKFLKMDRDEFDKFEPITLAEQIAYNSVLKSVEDLGYQKEVADRTEGKPKQAVDIDMTSKVQTFEIAGQKIVF